MVLEPHARYEELVVGLALSALEPEDEQLLQAHLAACAACERDLARHRETLGHLAYAVEAETPPPTLWEGIRGAVIAESGAGAFATSSGSRVVELDDARRRRGLSPRRRAATWASVAAALVLVGSLGAGVVRVQHEHSASDRLAAAVRAVETSPGRTVPMADGDGTVRAVAVVQADHLSLIVDGLARNDTRSSVYVLWGQSGADPATALATFDVSDSDLQVLRDLALPTVGTPVPQLFVITREPGRTAPLVSQQKALATGRAA